MDNYKIIKTIFIVLSIIYILSWIILQTITVEKQTSELLGYFSDSYGIVALWAGVIGISAAMKFGSYKSLLGAFIFTFSLGVIFQFFGQVINTYYRLWLQFEAPYPSFADVFYFLSIPIYIYGSMLVLRLLGAKKFFTNPYRMITGFLIIASIISLDYFLFLKDYAVEDYTAIQVFLDYSYPLLQATYIALTLLAYIITSNKLGGVFKLPIMLLLVALSIQYLADTTFTYELISETLYAGDLPDLLYVLSYAIIGVSFIEFREVYGDLNGTKIWEKKKL